MDGQLHLLLGCVAETGDRFLDLRAGQILKIDLVLLRYRAIIDLTHAVRDQDGLAGPGGSGKDGLVQGLASARQKTLARWFGHLAKDAEAHRHDPEIRAAIEATLAEIEQARPD